MKGPAVQIDRIVREVLAERRTAARVAQPSPDRSPDWLPTTRLVTLENINGRLDDRKELVVARGTIVTPLARDYLKECGVTLTYGVNAPENGTSGVVNRALCSTGAWRYAVVDAAGLADAAIASLRGTDIELAPLAVNAGADAAVRAAAATLAADDALGVILFGDNAALLACAANKRPPVRAAVGDCPQQVGRMVRTFAINLLAVEPGAKSLHQIRNIVRAFCNGSKPREPVPEIRALLGEG